MLDPSRHEPDRPPRLARAAAVCGASALSKGALPAATRERIALAVAIGFPAVAATHGRSSITWRSVMKVLITALALVTLIASPTFACQSGPHEYCDYPDTYWHCWDDVRCSAG
jgi:hypothetical protein